MTDKQLEIVYAVAAKRARGIGLDTVEDVEDFQQNVLLEVIERASKVDEVTDAWVVQSAKWAAGHAQRSYTASQDVLDLPDHEMVYLDEEIDSEEDEGLTNYELFGDDSYTPERALEEYEQRKILDNFLAGLLPIEEQVVRTTYGLDDDEPISQAELARRLDVSPAYISKIHASAIRKLKNRNIAEVLGL